MARLVLFALLLAMLATSMCSSARGNAPKTGPIGVETGRGHPFALVNHGQSARMWAPPAWSLGQLERALHERRGLRFGESVAHGSRQRPPRIEELPNGQRRVAADDDDIPIDESGWPKADVKGVIFDERPAFAWKPPEDDPQKKQPKESGVFKLSLTGNADVKEDSGSPVKVSNVKYDEDSNMLTADVTLPVGADDLMVIDFTNTRRTSKSANGTGFTNLRITYPGYDHDTDQLFVSPLYEALKPFDHMRFMGFLGTNYQPWMCGGDMAVYCSVIEWKDRPLPTDAMFGDTKVQTIRHATPLSTIMLYQTPTSFSSISHDTT